MHTRSALTKDLVERYLRILGVGVSEPSWDALARIVAAHILRVPFENVSKLYYRKRFGMSAPAPMQLFLDGIEQNHFGGTCYSSNFHLYELLVSLAYDVRLCGADMTTPNVHMVLIVTVGGREYLVDVGYGAPFFSPMARDLDRDYVIALGCDCYVLKPQDSEGCSRVELHRKGVLKHGYRVNPTPRSIDEFAEVISASFRPTATFLNSLLLVRYRPESSIVVHNFNLIESHGLEWHTRPLSGRDELIAAIECYFEIPGKVVSEAIDELPCADRLIDAWN